MKKETGRCYGACGEGRRTLGRNTERLRKRELLLRSTKSRLVEEKDFSLTIRRSSKKTGELIGAMVVNDNDEILLINSDGIIIRIKAGEVSRLGRATQGVKIMRVAEEANIITMAKVIKEDDDDLDENEYLEENAEAKEKEADEAAAAVN